MAFFSVFVFHTFRGLPIDGFSPALADIVPTIGGAGAFGVDLFFVLSAYLITELLLSEKALTGKLDVRAFYIRRILRIWPLYFFFLGLASLLPLVDPSQHFGWKYLLGYHLFGLWLANRLAVLTVFLILRLRFYRTCSYNYVLANLSFHFVESSFCD